MRVKRRARTIEPGAQWSVVYRCPKCGWEQFFADEITFGTVFCTSVECWPNRVACEVEHGR